MSISLSARGSGKTLDIVILSKTTVSITYLPKTLNALQHPPLTSDALSFQREIVLGHIRPVKEPDQIELKNLVEEILEYETYEQLLWQAQERFRRHGAQATIALFSNPSPKIRRVQRHIESLNQELVFWMNFIDRKNNINHLRIG